MKKKVKSKTEIRIPTKEGLAEVRRKLKDMRRKEPSPAVISTHTGIITSMGLSYGFILTQGKTVFFNRNNIINKRAKLNDRVKFDLYDNNFRYLEASNILLLND